MGLSTCALAALLCFAVVNAEQLHLKLQITTSEAGLSPATHNLDGSSGLVLNLSPAALVGWSSGDQGRRNLQSVRAENEQLPLSSGRTDGSAAGVVQTRSLQQANSRPRCLDDDRLANTVEDCNYGEYRSVAAGQDCLWYGYECSATQAQASAAAVKNCEDLYKAAGLPGGNCSLVLQDSIFCEDTLNSTSFDSKYQLASLQANTGPGRWWAFAISAGCEVGAAAYDYPSSQAAVNVTLSRCADGARALNYGPRPCTVARLVQVPLPTKPCADRSAWRDAEEQVKAANDYGFYALAITKDCRSAIGASAQQSTLQAARESALEQCLLAAANVSYGTNSNSNVPLCDVVASGGQPYPQTNPCALENIQELVDAAKEGTDYGRWLAVARDGTCRRATATFNANTRSVAETRALRDCAQNGAFSNCSVVVSQRMQCTNATVWASARTAAVAATRVSRYWSVAVDKTCTYVAQSPNQSTQSSANSKALNTCNNLVRKGAKNQCAVVARGRKSNGSGRRLAA